MSDNDKLGGSDKFGANSDLSALPRNILDSPLLKRTKVTRKSLPKYVEDVLLLYSPQHLPAAMTALLGLVKSGNLAAIKVILQMHNLLQAPGGISVTTNIQQAAIGSGGAESFSFDAVVRRLEEIRRTQAIEAPAVDAED